MPPVEVESKKEGGVFSKFFTKTNLAISVAGFFMGGPLGLGAAVGGIIGWKRNSDKNLVDRVGATIIGGLLGTAAVVTAAVATIASAVLGLFAGPVGGAVGLVGGAVASVYGTKKLFDKVIKAQGAFRAVASPVISAVQAIRARAKGHEPKRGAPEQEHRNEPGVLKRTVANLGRYLGYRGKGGASTTGKGGKSPPGRAPL